MLRKIFKVLFWGFIIWLFISAFLFQTLKVSSGCMQGNLFEGEYILINKTAYGARMPMTPLSFGKKYLDWISFPYMRLFGYADIKRNDVVVFNYSGNNELPIDLREKFISRCVALPGDTLKIANGILYANSLSNEPSNIFLPYSIEFTNGSDRNALREVRIIADDNVSGKRNKFYMSTEQAAALLKTGTLKSVTLDVFDKGHYDSPTFPDNENYRWNPDHFGPLYIPREDDSVVLTKANLDIYKKTIERFENSEITLKGDSVFVNGDYKKYHTFTQDYYFMIGDNRHNSTDSRNFGFIPASHIIGKASLILYSKKEGRSFSAVK